MEEPAGTAVAIPADLTRERAKKAPDSLMQDS